MRLLIRIFGSLVGLFVSLPMPWKVRVEVASILEDILAFLLKFAPSIYGFIIDDNIKFGMGKQHNGEMESIMALEIVVQEMEKQQVEPEAIKLVLNEAKAEKINNCELPKYLATRFFGSQRANILLDRIIAF